jgi:hypothetical protein
MSDTPLTFYPGQWQTTVVCGASGTGRTRFAYALAARYHGHVIDTGDVLTAVRAMTTAEQHPDLFYQDAEDHQKFPRSPLTGTAEEYAAARLRAADTLKPAVTAVMARQPGVRLDRFEDYPHTVVTGRHATPALGLWFTVVLLEEEDQIRANLKAKDPGDVSHDLRTRTSVLVQKGLTDRRRENGGHRTVFVNARPWTDAVDRASNRMGDYWDMDNALG